MKMHNLILLSALCALIPASPGFSQETLHPAGQNIIPMYYISSTNFEVSDTVTVIRVLLNNESYSLANLYVTEVLPVSFTLIDHYFTINDEITPVLFAGPISGEMVSGYNSYRWIIDSPNPGEPVNRIMMSGEFLELQYRFVANEPGAFVLPFHTICFYGDNTGFFTTSPNITVNATALPCLFIAGDANGNNHVNGIDIVFMINYLKGGNVPPVRCYCPPARTLFTACDVNGNCNFNGTDVTYLLNYLKFNALPLSYCPSCPPTQ